MGGPGAVIELADWTNRETVLCECCGDPVCADRVVTTCIGGHVLRVDPGCRTVLDWAHRVCKAKEAGVEIPSAVWRAVMASIADRITAAAPPGEEGAHAA